MGFPLGIALFKRYASNSNFRRFRNQNLSHFWGKSKSIPIRFEKDFYAKFKSVSDLQKDWIRFQFKSDREKFFYKFYLIIFRVNERRPFNFFVCRILYNEFLDAADTSSFAGRLTARLSPLEEIQSICMC